VISPGAAAPGRIITPFQTLVLPGDGIFQRFQVGKYRSVGDGSADIGFDAFDQAVAVLHKGKWRGRTPQNKLVFFEDADKDWRGQMAQVKITWAGPWSMQGSLQPAA